MIHGDRERLLGFEPGEHPVALQLGGSDPHELAEAAAHRRRLRLRRDQPQRRLPVRPRAGGPLRRLPDGRAGPGRALRRRHARARRRPGHRQVPHRHRRRRTARRTSTRFVDTVAAAGCRTFIVHARKAWLQGLSPKENREMPPLDYARVYRLKAARPDLTDRASTAASPTLDAAQAHLAHVDGVMLGRAAYQTPYLLADVDRAFLWRVRAARRRAPR